MTENPEPPNIVPITQEMALDLWYMALREEIGIKVPIVDPKDTLTIQNMLYDARKEIGDPRLAALALHIVEDLTVIHIYRKGVELED